MTREGLTEKYQAQPGVDVSRIEHVDFVWSGGSLSDAVPVEQHGTFDVFLASHVIEHTPDLVAFFNAAATLLKPDGEMILAVPDKRYCFDYFQPVTTTGHVLDAHFHQRGRHTGERAFDHFAYAITDGGAESWGMRPSQGLRLIHGLDTALQSYEMFENSSSYQDLHAWHFLPSSFELLLLELGRLGIVDWKIEKIVANSGWEFFAWLRRGAVAQPATMPVEELDRRRMALLKRTLLETQAQIDWLLANEPELTGEHGGLSTWATPLLYQKAVASLEKCQTELLDTKNHVRIIESQYTTAMQQMAALKASTFWRATAPFRFVLERVRRGKDSLSADK